MKVPFPSHLQRARFSAWATFITRALAATGLVISAVLAGAESNGLLSLAFLTAASLVSVAVVRAFRATRRATAALRFHRLLKEALNQLGPTGWHLKHDVRWPGGRGDGHLAMTATGDLAFAIKDCTASIDDFDLAQTQEFATALSNTGRPYVPICVAIGDKARSSTDRGVIGCTPELLVAELLDAERAFITSLSDEAAHSRLLFGESSGSAEQA